MSKTEDDTSSSTVDDDEEMTISRSTAKRPRTTSMTQTAVDKHAQLREEGADKPAKPPLRNAFQTLMSCPSRPRPRPPPTTHSNPNQPFRSALAPFLQNPTIPPCLRITPRTILIRDKYPKARVHYLLLPRNVNLTLTHPLTVLADPVIWDELRADVDVAISIAQDELRAAAAVGHGMDGVEADVRAGIHARPSLSNLHIHIISQDFRSPALKNAKHYLSFTTPFFIPFDFIPALKLYNSDNGVDVEGVEREVRVREEGLRGELRCVGCGEGFGRGFVRLKRHLEGCSGVMKGGIKRARRPSDD